MVDAHTLRDNLSGYSDSALKWVKNHPEWTLPAIFVLAFGESIAFVSLVLPFWAMLVTLGPVLTGSGYNFAYVLGAASVGAAIGDWVSYTLGYYFHDRMTRMYPFSKHPGIMEKGHAFFDKYGAWAIIAARFSGPLRATIPIIAGAVKMNWITFQIANFGSAILWAGVLLGLGTGIVTYWSQTIDYIYRLL